MQTGERSAAATGQIGVRLIDWVQVFTVPIELFAVLIASAFVLMLLLIWIKPSAAIAALLAAVIVGVPLVALPAAIYAQLTGYVFDPVRDQLVVPAYSIRRRLRLSEIRDANSEFAPRGTFFGAAMSALARAMNEGKGAKPQKLYTVNLSGTFGSRQARFMSKKRR